jgi:hypothetical protein
MTHSDTCQEAAAFQIQVLQAKTVSERLALTLALSATAIGLSLRAIKRANPAISDIEARCRFTELHYGKFLGDEFRRYISQSSDD